MNWLKSTNNYPSTPPDIMVEVISKKDPTSRSISPFSSYLPLSEALNHLSEEASKVGVIASLRISESWKETNQARTSFCYDSMFSQTVMTPKLALYVLKEAQSGDASTILSRAEQTLQTDEKLHAQGWAKISPSTIPKTDSWEEIV